MLLTVEGREGGGREEWREERGREEGGERRCLLVQSILQHSLQAVMGHIIYEGLRNVVC